MRGDYLLDVMGQIDAAYIEEAAAEPGTEPIEVSGNREREVFRVKNHSDRTSFTTGKKLRIFIGIAACFAVLVTAVIIADLAGWLTINSSRNDIGYMQDAYWFADAEEMVEQADLIISGKVADISQEADEDGIPYTIYEVTVDTVYKGETDGDTIRIRIVGGESEEYSVQNDLAVVEGGSYLFCVETYENEIPCILNDTQAVFDLESGKAATESALDSGYTLEDVMKALGE